MADIRQQTFEEWLAANRKELTEEYELDEGETCPECNGTGEVGCECIECGDEHKKECPLCDGKATVEFDVWAKEKFKIKADKDMMLMSKWLTEASP
jgi:DnaJ-class molecular chaperone